MLIRTQDFNVDAFSYDKILNLVQSFWHPILGLSLCHILIHVRKESCCVDSCAHVNTDARHPLCDWLLQAGSHVTTEPKINSRLRYWPKHSAIYSIFSTNLKVAKFQVNATYYFMINCYKIWILAKKLINKSFYFFIFELFKAYNIWSTFTVLGCFCYSNFFFWFSNLETTRQ